MGDSCEEGLSLAGVCRSSGSGLRGGRDGGLKTRRHAVDLNARLRFRFLLCLLLFHGNRGREIDCALDHRILMNDEARGDDVAGDLRGVAQLDAL